MISNEQLRTAFLSPQIKCCFEKKLPDLSSAELEVRIEQALKFLNMATYCRGRSIPVSQEIDDIWHLWILETEEYRKLCTLLQGGEFIHPRSNTYAECSGDGAEVPSNDFEHEVAMLATYVRNYGPFEPDRVNYWLFAAHLVNNGLTVKQLSQWLTSGTAAGSVALVRESSFVGVATAAGSLSESGAGLRVLVGGTMRTYSLGNSLRSRGPA